MQLTAKILLISATFITANAAVFTVNTFAAEKPVHYTASQNNSQRQAMPPIIKTKAPVTESYRFDKSTEIDWIVTGARK